MASDKERNKQTLIKQPEPDPAEEATAAPIESPFAKTEHRDPVIGTHVSGYLVKGRLGSGGMGIVYEGEQQTIGKRAAIKVLRPEVAENPDVVQRLVAEARAVNSVGQRGIIDVFAFGARYVKLLDFGIAKLGVLGNATPQSRASLMMGTPSYMAPEQAKGGNIGPAMDLYAVGVMAFEMFTGRLPFLADSVVAMLMAHQCEVPHAPSSVNLTLPGSAYWTGTNGGGTIGAACSSWTVTSGSSGTYGTAGSTSTNWTSNTNGATSCASSLSLRCFEQ